jgi:uncharacterized membrane protein
MTEQEDKKSRTLQKVESAEYPRAEENRDTSCEVLQRLEVEAPEILSTLPKDQRAKLLEIVSARVVERHGPIPPPEDIAQYNKHIPNGADRIMVMAERQADHRRDMERLIVAGQLKQSSRGQIFGLSIGIFGIAVGAAVALQGHDVVGGAIAGATVVSLVYAFITGQRSQRQEPKGLPPRNNIPKKPMGSASQ